jgi:2-dehydro-3-deoxyphosphogluconate aldolase/(4S)-4-hydroxy-2-oxoglutarate aldolase
MPALIKDLKNSKVIPVVTVNDVNDVLELLEVFETEGIGSMEITLRTSNALQCIEAAAKRAEKVVIGAGTIIDKDQFNDCVDAGARFLVSPGTMKSLLKKGGTSDVFYLPGVQTVSDVMRAINFGYKHVKFFPAEQAGGLAFLKTLHGLFPELSFCPTGGIDLEKSKVYLEQDYIFAVGGSWMVPSSLMEKKDWQGIRALCQKVVDASQVCC